MLNSFEKMSKLKFVSANRAKARKARKAQVGSEMVFAAGIIIFIFIIMIPVSIKQRNEVRDTSILLDKINDCKTFINALTRVASTENLEVTISFKNKISLRENSRIVDVDGVLCTSLLSLPENQNLTKGDVEIKNENGELKIKEL